MLYKFQNMPRWIGAIIIVLGIGLVSIIIFISLITWYQLNLSPLRSGSSTTVRFVVAEGESNDIIATKLEQQKIISSALSMEWYLKTKQPNANLKAGAYAISPGLSVPQIVARLKSGKTDFFMVTILPGSTLQDIKKKLEKYGYQVAEIDAAFKANYSSPLLASRPPGQDLEGYLFPETFEVQADSSVESLLQRDLDAFYNQVQSNGLLDKFTARGLSFYQVLTLASIVQKETGVPSDQKKVAQVFYKRLATSMKLESDTTFMYAAKKLGVSPSVSLDSPYNTRLNSGLPPGPISNMNLSALQAVADPAPTDYLYFVAGDNGVTHYANTLAEHENNIQQYCHKLCR